MAKKHSGYKSKNMARIIATLVTTGTVLLTAVGANIYTKLNARPTPDRPTNDYVGLDDEVHDIVTEPGINSGDNTNGNDSNNNLNEDRPTSPDAPNPDINKEPTINEGVLPEPPVKEDTDIKTETVVNASFIDVLAKITSLCKDYYVNVFPNTNEPNLTATGINALSIDSNTGLITVLGELSINGNVNGFTASISNPNPNFDIYNLAEGMVSEATFVNALDEVLSDAQTGFKFQLKQTFKVNDESKVIKNILQNRLNNLQNSNQTDTVKEEITYINKLLNNVNNLDLSVVLHNREKADNGYKYSFATTISTSKYQYYTQHTFTTDRQLNTNDLKSKINSVLLGDLQNSVTYKNSNTAIDNALHQINTKAQDYDYNENLSK